MGDEIMAISAAEYKALMGMSAKMAETIDAIQDQNKTTQEAVKAMVEKQTEVLDTLKALFEKMSITVNVPEQPAPVVNLPAAKSRQYTIVRERGVIVGIQEAADE